MVFVSTDLPGDPWVQRRTDPRKGRFWDGGRGGTWETGLPAGPEGAGVSCCQRTVLQKSLRCAKGANRRTLCIIVFLQILCSMFVRQKDSSY